MDVKNRLNFRSFDKKKLRVIRVWKKFKTNCFRERIFNLMRINSRIRVLHMKYFSMCTMIYFILEDEHEIFFNERDLFYSWRLTWNILQRAWSILFLKTNMKYFSMSVINFILEDKLDVRLLWWLMKMKGLFLSVRKRGRGDLVFEQRKI